jgi:aryl-alcohol dehydrogenase-like predicted oxidoreductase
MICQLAVRRLDIGLKWRAVAELPHRLLGASGIEVSCLALGSWRTYERMSREDGIAVMRAARDSGIDFLDDARYNDETGNAPMPTGYSEVVFGELFRAARWERDRVTVANKLWWEFWPEQSAADELDASLGRMGLDHVDLIYTEPPREGLELRNLVEQVLALIGAGKARAWGLLNWTPDQIEAGTLVADELSMPAPCAAQLPYSLVRRDWVEDPEQVEALRAAGASVVASYTLAGGTLTGKYAAGEGGRMEGSRDDPSWQLAFETGEELRRFADERGESPAALALAFALANPLVASVLFGATRPGQIAQNLQAVELLDRLSGEDLTALRQIGAAGS